MIAVVSGNRSDDSTYDDDGIANNCSGIRDSRGNSGSGGNGRSSGGGTTGSGGISDGGIVDDRDPGTSSRTLVPKHDEAAEP
ncbi:hypothetical protein PF008_g1625 [Phytophthora fragariae]|uniref:Uncharacterized protein n=1 Tax=Phytophthora fragariae TaxID=53985 RepID=A0A6G0SJF5_9STRA|nr:hypothetical protein PF008_g1625 [Phytophthora fragariae]